MARDCTNCCCAVQLDAVTINLDGGVASLRIEGFQSPMPLYVGVAEAAAILYASGMEFRRPSTVNAWLNSLKVCEASDWSKCDCDFCTASGWPKQANTLQASRQHYQRIGTCGQCNARSWWSHV